MTYSLSFLAEHVSLADPEYWDLHVEEAEDTLPSLNDILASSFAHVSACVRLVFESGS